MPNTRSEKIKYVFTENIGYKVLALVITVFLWTFVMGRDDAIETKDMTLEVYVASSHDLLLVQPTKVQVTMKGTPKLLRRYFNYKKTIRFDVLNTDASDIRIEVRDEQLDVPYGLRVVTITPRHFDIRIRARPGFQRGQPNSVVVPATKEEKTF
jgi:hypothetical protein